MAMLKWRISRLPCSIPRRSSASATSSSSGFPISCIPVPTIPGSSTRWAPCSLRTWHARGFGLAEDERRLVIAAALLHDIGHGPFSHASEPLMEEFLHRTHDDIDRIVEESGGTCSGILVSIPMNSVPMVKGKHPLSGIIHGDLDVDRMDYLLRDAYYTGAPYGTVDAQRLIRHLIRTPTKGPCSTRTG